MAKPIDGMICYLYGGLGNQMFMASAAFIVNKVKKYTINFLLREPSAHNIKNINYHDILFKNIGKEIVMTQDNLIELIIKKYEVPIYKSPFVEWDYNVIKERTIFSWALFQYYPPIKQFETEIRESYLAQLEPYRIKLCRERDFSGQSFLHIRRGDYLKRPKYHFNLGLDYYKKAMSILNPVRKVLIVTDDVDWVKKDKYFSTNIFEVFEGDEIESMALMTLCKQGAICANSTFSWWGAFLGSHADRNTVIVPNKWINEKIVCLFPEEWTVI